MSHLQGTDYVGSMVVLRGRSGQAFGLPALQGQVRRRQRRLRRDGRGTDAAAHRPEAADRATGGRAAAPLRLPAQPASSSTGARGSSGWPSGSCASSGSTDEVELASLAKQFEEVYRPGSPDPVRLRRGSDALYLLQRLRDEAHRFAITFHRERRGKRMTTQHPRRHPWAGPGPQGPPRQGAGRGERRPGGPPRGAAVAVLAARRGRTRRLRGDARCWGAQGWGAQGWRAMSEFVVVTGMSGAGRSTAAAALEDVGWFVIDNLPAGPDHEDGRDGGPSRVRDRAGGARDRARGQQHGTGVLRRPARRAGRAARHPQTGAGRLPRRPDDVLVRRYEGTRRRHPLAARGVEESIADERKLLGPVRERADLLVDTGELNSNQLRQRILEAFGDDEAPHMQTSVDLLRLQARHPARRRRGLRLPLPAQPVLGGGAAALQRRGPARARLRARPARVAGLPGEGGRSAHEHPPRLRPRGEVVPDHRHGLHGRAAPLGDAGPGAGRRG